VRAYAIAGSGSWMVNLRLLLAGGTHDFVIEQWTIGKERPEVETVLAKFWPPADVDQTEAWACHCGRPTEDGNDDKGHWEWRVPVVLVQADTN